MTAYLRPGALLCRVGFHSWRAAAVDRGQTQALVCRRGCGARHETARPIA